MAKSPNNRSLRLVFEYEGRSVKLVSVERLAMLAPPPQTLVPGNDTAWFELRNREGQPLYRRTMFDPVQQDIEVALEDKGRPLARVPVAKPAGRFFLVVPDLEAASRVVVRAGLRVATAPTATGAAIKPADVAPIEFDLTAHRIDEKEGR